MSEPRPAHGSIAENQRAAWSEYRTGELRVRSRPFKASIEITRNCNFKCNMCPQSWSPEHQEYHPEYNMSPALFRKVAHELFPQLEYAHLQGYGETVISPHWPEILELCRPYADRLRFGLVTNLSRKSASMWRSMVELDFHILFSCDGAKKDTFEAIRGLSRFEAILENLETIQQARRELGRGHLELLVTLQGLNYREMPLFVDLAERYGADRIGFKSVMGARPVSRGLPSWTDLGQFRANRIGAYARRLLRRATGKGPAITLGNTAVGVYECPREELTELKRETLRKAAKAGVPVSFNDAYLAGLGEESKSKESFPGRPPLSLPGDFRRGIAESAKVALYQRCFKPYSYVVVNYKGDVGLCNHLITDSSWKQMGNLMLSSMEDIWNSETYREARRRLISAEPDNPSCRWCFKHRMTD